MRLIDADALKPTLNMILKAENQIYGDSGWGFTAECIQAIDDAPTITTMDVNKVVESIATALVSLEEMGDTISEIRKLVEGADG